MAETIYPFLLSGGSGTRLWPLSRVSFPKQFIAFGRDELSFLQTTALRLNGIPGFAAPSIICNNEHRFLVADQLEAVGVAPREIILEPVPRNTAAAAAIAALSAQDAEADAVLALMPSDHVIENVEVLVAGLRGAGEIARTGRLVTFGMPPTSPKTGYGYIRRGAPLGSGDAPGFQVDSFVEKPDLATATRFCADGEHFWNAGIFVMHAGTLIEELERHRPGVVGACREALARAARDLQFLRLDAEAFGRSPSDSIDYAVMEKTTLAAVLPLDAGWMDIGSWSALWERGDKDAHGNTISGTAVLEDVSGSIVHSDRSLVAALGVENLVIVDTPDALLVAAKDRAQDVSRLVERLKEANRPEPTRHVFSHRPWGRYETLSLGPRFQVKHLRVKPGGKLSLQMHHHRSEHWVVVSGTARVTRGDEEFFLNENESTYISPTEWHRLENPGKTPLEIIEVQLGGYLGEDDIIRSDDVYRRRPDETG